MYIYAFTTTLYAFAHICIEIQYKKYTQTYNIFYILYITRLYILYIYMYIYIYIDRDRVYINIVYIISMIYLKLFKV